VARNPKQTHGLTQLPCSWLFERMNPAPSPEMKGSFASFRLKPPVAFSVVIPQPADTPCTASSASPASWPAEANKPLALSAGGTPGTGVIPGTPPHPGAARRNAIFVDRRLRRLTDPHARAAGLPSQP